MDSLDKKQQEYNHLVATGIIDPPADDTEAKKWIAQQMKDSEKKLKDYNSPDATTKKIAEQDELSDEVTQKLETLIRSTMEEHLPGFYKIEWKYCKNELPGKEYYEVWPMLVAVQEGDEESVIESYWSNTWQAFYTRFTQEKLENVYAWMPWPEPPEPPEVNNKKSKS